MRNREHKTLGDLEDRYIGMRGAPGREQYEFELSMEILGAKLREIRKERGLTQAEFGRMIGVQKAQISKIENGANSATISTIMKVFSALHATIRFRIEYDTGDRGALYVSDHTGTFTIP